MFQGPSIQRYKGLGEVDADQLRENKFDPQNRSMPRVEVMHGDVADETFSPLMGDVVEPRGKFVKDNVLSINNLDVFTDRMNLFLGGSCKLRFEGVCLCRSDRSRRRPCAQGR